MATAPRSTSPAQGSKSARIRALLATGMSASAIAKEVGCSPNLVYVVRSNAGSSGTSRRAARATRRTAGDAVNGLDGILAAVKNSERERTELRAALAQIRDVIDAALHG